MHWYHTGFRLVGGTEAREENGEKAGGNEESPVA